MNIRTCDPQPHWARSHWPHQQWMRKHFWTYDNIMSQSVSLSVSVYLCEGQVSVCRLSSWRQQVRGHDPESSWASWVKTLIRTKFSNKNLKSVASSLLTSDCVLFIAASCSFIGQSRFPGRAESLQISTCWQRSLKEVRSSTVTVYLNSLYSTDTLL